MRFNHSAIRTIVAAAALTMMVSSACAFDETKYPTGRGNGCVRAGSEPNGTRPSRAASDSKAPMRPEYLERLKASLADQAPMRRSAMPDLAYGSRGPQHRDDLAAAVRHIKR
jgi:hypothetical protein